MRENRTQRWKKVKRMRLIDADSMKADLLTVDPQYETMIQWCITVLDAQPTIEERKRGKWEIYVISPFDGEGCRCSECKYEGAPYWDYCPNCGAKMEV